MKRDWAGVVDSTILRLYLATFVSSLGTSAFTIAVPFYVLARLGVDRPDAVGYVVAVSTIGYLTSCLVVQMLTRVSPRTLTAIATAGNAICMFLFSQTTTLPQMLLAIAGQGLALGMLWPPLMGWLSGSAEGVPLSRRLGLFNIAWSTALIIAPPIAGQLAETSVLLPLYMMVITMALASVIFLATPYRHQEPHQVAPAQATRPGIEPLLLHATDPALFKQLYIRYLAWTGVVVGYMAIAVYRYQMPHLAKLLGMPEGKFGIVMMALSLAISISFFIAARWSGWHGRVRWIFIPQIVLVAVSGLLMGARSAVTMIPLMLVGGLAAGALYTNSIFYGSLGAAPAVRTRRMAIHEIMISVGVIAGSFGGNKMSEVYGPASAYACLAGAIGVILLVQLLAWNLLARRGGRVVPGAPAGAPIAAAALKPVLAKKQ